MSSTWPAWRCKVSRGVWRAGTGHIATVVRHIVTTMRHIATTVRHIATTVRHIATTVIDIATTVIDIATTVRHIATTVRHIATTVTHSNNSETHSNNSEIHSNNSETHSNHYLLYTLSGDNKLFDTGWSEGYDNTFNSDSGDHINNCNGNDWHGLKYSINNALHGIVLPKQP